MGGGDLNLKKSWHPSTLKNQERVWKAQQQDEMEKKKTEQLQQEIRLQRDKEHYQSLADEARGSSEKKGKMDWMYKGVSALVDREDYLLGRKIDKTFDVIKAAEEQEGKPAEETTGDGLPSQLFRQKGDADFVAVDMATKVREDPLYIIKKQEYESKKQLLSNPVKMKMLQDMIAKEKSAKKKKHKKSKKKSDGSDLDEDDIDAKIAQYREKLSRREAADDERRTSKHSSKGSHSTKRDDDESRKFRPTNVETSPRHRRRDVSRSPQEGRRRSRTPKRKHRSPERKRRRSSSPEKSKRSPPRSKRSPDSSGRKRTVRSPERRQNSVSPKRRQSSESPRRKQNSRSPERRRRDQESPRQSEKRREDGFGLIKSSKHSSSNDGYLKKDYRLINEERKKKEEEERRQLQKRLGERHSRKMTQEEKEIKLREMQQDAAVHEKQRLEYVKRHTKADAIEVEGYREGGFRGAEMLAKAVDSSSVERRLKSNLKGVQRSNRAMETNFLRK